MPTQLVRRGAAMISFVLLGACASGSTGPQAEPSSPQLSTTIEVENHHWLDVVIYVVHDGVRSRLGTVTAASTMRFRCPPRMMGQLGQIRLVADPVGARAMTTSETVSVQRGQRVQWTLESSLQRSSLAVW